MSAEARETRTIRLDELLGGLGGTSFGIWEDVSVLGISTDSRRVETGDLFVALAGEMTHGLRYVEAAQKRGAVACLIPEGTDDRPCLPGLSHPDPASLLPQIACRLYGDPGEHLQITGVTGTNGKTTTALLVAALLEAGGFKTSSWTTTAVSLGDTLFRPRWTTPPANELQRFLRSAVDREVTHAVLEVSSHGVALGRIGGVRFAAGIATNISPDHLDFHGSFEGYVATKRAFIEALPESSAAFLSDEDPEVRNFGEKAVSRVFRFGFSDRADLFARDVRVSNSSLSFDMVVTSTPLTGSAKPVVLPITFPLTGRHNVLNCLAAAGAALWQGVPIGVIPEALDSFLPPPRRLERIQIGTFTVVNDVAMNEASYEAVLRTVAELGQTKPVVVHAIRGQRGPEVNARIAGILAKWNEILQFSPLIVSLSRDRLDHYLVDYQVQGDELAAFSETAQRRGLDLSLHGHLEGAVQEAVSRLNPGGLLLLLGTFGMDDGPALAQSLLEKRLGLPPSPPIRYLDQSDSPL